MRIRKKIKEKEEEHPSGRARKPLVGCLLASMRLNHVIGCAFASARTQERERKGERERGVRGRECPKNFELDKKRCREGIDKYGNVVVASDDSIQRMHFLVCIACLRAFFVLYLTLFPLSTLLDGILNKIAVAITPQNHF